MSEITYNLLVVDDDERIRNLLSQYLIKEGFIVSTANGAEQARKKIQLIKFDLIILDIMMPGDGNNCRVKIDLYGFNSTDEEAGNTSNIGVEQRSHGSDCDDDTDCVWLQFTGSYHFSESQWKDGEDKL